MRDSVTTRKLIEDLWDFIENTLSDIPIDQVEHLFLLRERVQNYNHFQDVTLPGEEQRARG